MVIDYPTSHWTAKSVLRKSNQTTGDQFVSLMIIEAILFGPFVVDFSCSDNWANLFPQRKQRKKNCGKSRRKKNDSRLGTNFPRCFLHISSPSSAASRLFFRLKYGCYYIGSISLRRLLFRVGTVPLERSRFSARRHTKPTGKDAVLNKRIRDRSLSTTSTHLMVPFFPSLFSYANLIAIYVPVW